MRMFKGRRLAVIAGAALALVFTGTSIAVAVATVHSGTTVAHTTVLTETSATTFSGTSFVNLATSSVFAGAGSFIVATFSAESACYNGSGWCSVRILIDGVEAEPVVGTDFAFDSTDGNRETAASWESHSMQRTRTVTTTATHSVVVQVAQVGAGVTARYDDWALTSMAIAP